MCAFRASSSASDSRICAMRSLALFPSIVLFFPWIFFFSSSRSAMDLARLVCLVFSSNSFFSMPSISEERRFRSPLSDSFEDEDDDPSSSSSSSVVFLESSDSSSEEDSSISRSLLCRNSDPMKLSAGSPWFTRSDSISSSWLSQSDNLSESFFLSSGMPSAVFFNCFFSMSCCSSPMNLLRYWFSLLYETSSFSTCALRTESSS
mmetsp:Transcript_19916/g.46743  ORF Transcript_19916/g.46743 Transcript_19916/m.46743 type:complete len:205 (-) Transcript_19916:3233-3847(-)